MTVIEVAEALCSCMKPLSNELRHTRCCVAHSVWAADDKLRTWCLSAMSSCQIIFGGIGDELIIEQILNRVARQYSLSVTCKHLNRLVRLSVQTLHLTEESALCVARLPASDSYSHCRGFTYEVYDDDDPGLPGFTDLVSRISTCWPSLSDLAITVGRPSDVTSAIRQGNYAVLSKLHHLTCIRSLRQLQLFKTAPFISDAAQLALLTQLTALVLADNSYIPGPAAMVTVDISPLAALTNLKGLAVMGVCPNTSTAVDAAAAATGLQEYSTYTGSSGCLPDSLTALVLKDFDDAGLQLWLPHMWSLTALKTLHVRRYCEGRTQAHAAYPAQYLELIADRLTSLQELEMGVDEKGERRKGSAKCALPLNITRLQQLRMLWTTKCQVTVDTPEQWEAVGNLPCLSMLHQIEMTCTPSTAFVMSALHTLCISATSWAAGGGLNLHNNFPNLRSLRVTTSSPQQWWSITPSIQECSMLEGLSLFMYFDLDARCVQSLRELGDRITYRQSLREVIR